MYSYGPPRMAEQKQDGQRELTYSSYVKTQDVTLKTCRRRWTIGRSGERLSGISVLAARHDDDDDDIYIYIYIYTYKHTHDYWMINDIPSHEVSQKREIYSKMHPLVYRVLYINFSVWTHCLLVFLIYDYYINIMYNANICLRIRFERSNLSYPENTRLHSLRCLKFISIVQKKAKQETYYSIITFYTSCKLQI